MTAQPASTFSAPLTAISTTNAPGAVGPYSQAVRTGDLLFVSGQLPIDPATGVFALGGIGAETTQSLRNAEAILLEAGTSLDNVVKTTVLVTDLADFAEINAAYGAVFTGPVQPARAAYQVAALPMGARVEVELVAACRPVDSVEETSRA
ncbi:MULTISPECIES: Rid family detoxifying hydrolase [Subtercola]|uniref:RidA family protein n=1 Tax=Subtercola vilae TaxID=2056433 RepID=A0A4T2C4I1_9MICO|nr:MULTISPECIES: Rid family detoxifying hydrolase [Subtercola]MEA9984761.1 Rid family detoxifying hydrolase [Subtercola sp. RTI3]TIH39007.1 RidA family protein [Subtercola vilae]